MQRGKSEFTRCTWRQRKREREIRSSAPFPSVDGRSASTAVSPERERKEEGIWFRLTLLPFQQRCCSGSVVRAGGWGSVWHKPPLYLKQPPSPLPSSLQEHHQHTGTHKWVRCDAFPPLFASSFVEIPPHSLQRLCTSGWAGINLRSRCAEGSASLRPHRLTSPDVAPCTAELVSKGARRLGVFSRTFPMLYSWLESRAWECGASTRERFRESGAGSHWWVADVDTFTFTLCLSAHCVPQSLPSSVGETGLTVLIIAIISHGSAPLHAVHDY